MALAYVVHHDMLSNRELVFFADGANTIDTIIEAGRSAFPTIHLSRAGIVSKIYTIFLRIRPSGGHYRAVGPPQTTVIARIAGAVACNHKKHQVHISVLVAVIISKVDICVSCINSCVKNSPRIARAIGIILAVINLIRTYHVKLRRELTQSYPV